MRSLAALTIYVSLSLFLSSSAHAAGWRDVHDAALETSSRHEFEQTSALLRQAWQLASTPTEKAIAANDLGVTLHALSREAEAQTWLTRAMALWPATPETICNRARTAEALAVVDRAFGDYDAAEQVLRDALAMDLPDGESRADLLNQLGDMLREVGRSAEARAAFDKVLSTPAVTTAARAGAILGLADLDRNAHLWAQSIEGWNRALTISREQHWTIMEASALRGLGDTLTDKGETSRAEPLLERALAIFESADRATPEVGSTLQSLARLMIAEDKPALATEALERALVIDEKVLGNNHPQIAIVLEMLGDAAARRGRMDDARNRYARAHFIMAAKFGERSVMVAAVQASWALNEQRAKMDAAAAQDYESAVGILREAGSDTNTLLLSVMRNYADALDGAHRKHEASAVRSQMKTAFQR